MILGFFGIVLFIHSYICVYPMFLNWEKTIQLFLFSLSPKCFKCYM